MRLPFWLKWLGVNVFFAACHPELLALGMLPKSLAVNAALFVLPALGWNHLIGVRARRLGMRAFATVVVSSVVFVTSLAAVLLLKLTPTAGNVWVAIWLATNLGFALAAVRSKPRAARRSLLPREAAIAGLAFAACYGLYYWGATRVVPQQLDHDLEVQATGYGLINRLEPLLLTDRGSVYYFAHPPLLHLYVAGSFLLHGKIADLAFYDEVSVRALERRRGQTIPPPTGTVHLFGQEGGFRVVADQGDYYLLAPEGGGPEVRVPADRVDTSRIIEHYVANPNMLETRTPNIFFAALTVALLAVWAGRISHRTWLGVLVAVVYASSAEVFVRSSYGGYFALGAFASIALLLAGGRWRRARAPVISGAFAALADHKLVLLPAAYAISRAFLWLRRWGTSRLGRLLQPKTLADVLHPAAVGFAVGTGLFWLYGVVIAPWDFYQDHVRQHLVNRVAHIDDFGYSGYPSALGLWSEFNAHTGYVLLPVAVFLIAMDLFARSGAAGRRATTERGPWALYLLLTAVTFTLIDWRMTKHLMPMLLPLFLALAPDRRAAKWRVAVPAAALLLVLAYNVSTVSHIALDFTSFSVTPDW